MSDSRLNWQLRRACSPCRWARSQRQVAGRPIERTVVPGATIITDDWSGYAKLGERGYCYTAAAERGDMQVAETSLPIIHLVFSNLKTCLLCRSIKLKVYTTRRMPST